MNIPRYRLKKVLPVVASMLTALAFATSPISAQAQSQASAPYLSVPRLAPAASSVAPIAPGVKPPQRLLTPEEKRDSNAQPDDLKVDRAVAPQLTIPFGKTPPSPAKGDARAARRSPAASAVGVDDGVARCEAEADDATRAICRDNHAKAAKRTTPI
jgi:hypothetical protein